MTNSTQHRSPRRRSAAFGVPATLLVGCSLPAWQNTVRDPPYSWGMRNESRRVLGVATVVTYPLKGGGTFRAVSGVLSPGTNRTADGGRDPIPASVHVHVADEASEHFREYDVPVRGHIPDEATFTGTLWLVVTDDAVFLRPGRDEW